MQMKRYYNFYINLLFTKLRYFVQDFFLINQFFQLK